MGSSDGVDHVAIEVLQHDVANRGSQLPAESSDLELHNNDGGVFEFGLDILYKLYSYPLTVHLVILKEKSENA